MRSMRHRHDIQANRDHLVYALLLAGGMLLNLIPALTLADQPLTTMTAGYQSGTITAVYPSTFQIDGRTYSFTPDAVVLDENGNQLDAGYIRVGAETKFHVKKDQNDKIDKMVLILPR